MSSLETIQKLAPWASSLPFAPKLAISAVVILIAFVFLYLLWAPKPNILPQESPVVVKAYDRMKRVLSRIGYTENGMPTVDGKPIEERLIEYYSPYLAISEYINQNPGDIKGTYEKIWEHGGQGRVMINDTEAFETVARAFFLSFEQAAAEK
jgi:hypothetical protein